MILKEDKKVEYYKTLKVANSYRDKIDELYKEIDAMMIELDEDMPEYEREDRNIDIKTKAETMKALMQEYKKRNNEMSIMSNAEDVSKHINNLQEVLNLFNRLATKMDAAEEGNKKKLALSKSEQLEGMKLSKFNGQGDQKFLNYYGFYQEFTELVLSKPYSDSTKLRYLKQYLEGEAKDIVRNYHSGSELRTAFRALDDVYGRADMVIRECIKSIQNLEPLRNEHNIKVNKQFLYKVTSDISTLRCYNFDIDTNEEENSTFMISIEEKLPQETFLKWEDKKSELRKANNRVTIDAFIKFFSEKVRREENVNFIRTFSKSETDSYRSPTNKTKAKLFQTKVTPYKGKRTQNPQKHNYNHSNFYEKAQMVSTIRQQPIINPMVRKGFTASFVKLLIIIQVDGAKLRNLPNNTKKVDVINIEPASHVY